MQALILDFDRSVDASIAAPRIDCTDLQELTRFGCTRSQWHEVVTQLGARMPKEYGTVLFGSGDFHHLSHCLLSRRQDAQPVDVLVFDNHPDNMRFPFGIHCGSWVRHAAQLPGVRRIHVAGITSADVSRAQAWENYLGPLRAGKLCYWTIGVDTRWARWLGLQSQFQSFAHADAMFEALCSHLHRDTAPIYLSIDKDVLSVKDVQTNWDQGQVRILALCDAIRSVQPRIVGSDITGEVSMHHYSTRWKRWLAARDGQPDIPAQQLRNWQAQHAIINQQLLAAIRLN